MTLDERIERDLTDLYNGGSIDGEISEAKELQGVIAAELSAKGMPGHFTGNRQAKTVFVTLNPGQNAYDKKGKNGVIMGADNPASVVNEIKKLRIITSSLEEFIESYKKGKTNYGELTHNKKDPNKKDPFDLKQAAFFKSWKNSGINIPIDFPDNKSIYETATKEVLMNKLQLELIPYCSNIFRMSQKEKIYPYIETLFEEIFSREREYVVFASKIFEMLFKDEDKIKTVGAEIKFVTKQYPPSPLTKKDGTPAKTKFNCTIIKIKYKGKEQKALIAPTFFKQGVAGNLLCKYGDFCYNEYIKA